MTMDPQTLSALRASIAHWERNAKTENFFDSHIGVRHCALCTLFNRQADPCSGCPVQAKTSQAGCDGSPYSFVAEVYRDWGDVDEDDAESAERFRTAAQAELDFLKSLLPEGEPA